MKNSITIKDLEILFAGLQQSEELFEIKIDRWSLWAVIKTWLFFKIRNNIVSVQQQTVSPQINTQKLELARIARDFALGYLQWQRVFRAFNKKQERPVVMGFGYSSDRYKYEDGRYKHAFFDDIYQSGKRMFDMFVVEQANGRERLRNCTGPRHLRGEYIMFPPVIAARLFKPRQETQIKLKKLLDLIKIRTKSHPEIYAIVKEEFDGGFAGRCVQRFYGTKKRASNVIDSVNPSVVLVINSPGHYGVIAAAKERNIPVIEIQHGDISSYYPAVCWPAWTRKIKTHLPIPDKLFMFGRFWTDQLVKNGFWKDDEVLPLGNCRLDEFRQKIRSSNSNAGKTNNSDSIKLLFTTQQTTRKDALAFLEEALQIATDNNVPLTLYIKVHPVEENSVHIYKVLQNKYPDKCIVCHPNDESLYDLMSACDIHFSVYSTCLYESIAIGKPSAVLDLNGKEYVSGLFESKSARLCGSTKELVGYAVDVKGRTRFWQRWVSDTQKAQTFFFTADAAESHINHLNNLIAS